MRSHRSRGLAQVFADGGVIEYETYTCCHCNSVKRQNFGEDLAMCIKCYKPVCPRCHAHGRCVPFERKLAHIESRASILKAAGVL